MKCREKITCDDCNETIFVGEEIAKNNEWKFIHFKHKSKINKSWLIFNKNDPITLDRKILYLWIIYQRRKNNINCTFLMVHKLISIVSFHTSQNYKNIFTNNYYTKGSIENVAEIGFYFQDLQRDMETDFATGILKFDTLDGQTSDFYRHNLELTQTGKHILLSKLEQLERKLTYKKFNILQDIIKKCSTDPDPISVFEKSKLYENLYHKSKNIKLIKDVNGTNDKNFYFTALLPAASFIEINFDILEKEFRRSYKLTEENSGEFTLIFTDEYRDDWCHYFNEFYHNQSILKSIRNDFKQKFTVRFYKEGIIEITGKIHLEHRVIMKRQFVEFCYAIMYTIEDTVLLPNIAEVDKRTGSGLLYYSVSFDKKDIEKDFIYEIEQYLKKLDEDVFDIFSVSLIKLQDILHRTKLIPLLYHIKHNTTWPTFRKSELDEFLQHQGFHSTSVKKFKMVLDILQIRSYRTSVNFLLFSKTVKRIIYSQNTKQFQDDKLRQLENISESYSVHFDFVHNGFSTPIRLYAALIAINGIMISILVSAVVLGIGINYDTEGFWKTVIRGFGLGILTIIGLSGLYATSMKRMKTAIDGLSRTFNITPFNSQNNFNKIKDEYIKMEIIELIHHTEHVKDKCNSKENELQVLEEVILNLKNESIQKSPNRRKIKKILKTLRTDITTHTSEFQDILDRFRI